MLLLSFQCCPCQKDRRRGHVSSSLCLRILCFLHWTISIFPMNTYVLHPITKRKLYCYSERRSSENEGENGVEKYRQSLVCNWQYGRGFAACGRTACRKGLSPEKLLCFWILISFFFCALKNDGSHFLLKRRFCIWALADRYLIADSVYFAFICGAVDKIAKSLATMIE